MATRNIREPRFGLRARIALLALTTTFVVVGAFGWFWWIDSFLGPSSFVGTPLYPTNPAAPLGQTTFNGFLLFTNLDRTLVSKLVPAGYQLAANKSFWNKQKHPVALVFGDQTDATAMLGGNPLPSTGAIPVLGVAATFDRLHYSEMILAIPFVQKAGQAGWHTYIARMYLDDLIMVAGGNLAYGYSKKFACLEWTGSRVRIWQKGSTCPPVQLIGPVHERLEGEFNSSGSFYAGPAAMTKLPKLPEIRDIWKTRLIGKGPAGLVCSYFDWSFADARVAHAATRLKFKSAFRPEMAGWPGLGDLFNSYQGAVMVLGMEWKLGSSFPC